MSATQRAVNRVRSVGRLTALRATQVLWDIDRAPLRNVRVYSAYRRRNEDIVRAFIDGLPRGATGALHCLDGVPDPSDPLGEWTVRSGAGWRIPILQQLIDDFPPRSGEDILIFDDDVRLTRRPIRDFVALAQVAELDLAQPAHAPGSIFTWRVTRQLPFGLVRLTKFVEVGPVVLMSPRAQQRILPFPEGAQMGWGLDVSWSAGRGDLRLGVVDATPMLHVGSVAADYSMGLEEERLDAARKAAGVGSLTELDRGEGPVWRPWQRAAPWISSGEGLGLDLGTSR